MKNESNERRNGSELLNLQSLSMRSRVCVSWKFLLFLNFTSNLLCWNNVSGEIRYA